MDFRYARPPPPPPSSDPHQPPQQPPVPPPPGSWFSGQFQYHAPSPPPPQWAPQHSDHHLPPPPSYAAAPPPPMPYPSNPYSLPPRPHMLPPQPQTHYPPVNQEWSNTNWGHQGCDYSAHNKNEDDWAARARAWAASKAVTDDQRQHSLSVPANRPEEMNYQDQYSQNFDPSYPEFQQHSLPPTSTYQQYSSAVAPPLRMTTNHLQDPSTFSSGYASDGHFSYAARDGNLRDSAAAYPHQETAPTSLSVHQQEVPSSYSSVAGKEELRDVNGKFYQQSHGAFASAQQHQIQQPMSPTDRSIPVEHPQYAFNNSSADPTTDLSNQPLDFGPPYGQPKYGHESGGPSLNAWTSSAAPGIPYSSMPPIHPAGQQADPSSVSMHTSPLSGGMISSFQPSMPSANTTFPIGTSNAFNGDSYGFPERPKKASVPNWLREEIIKKKAVIGSSAPEVSRQETESNEDEVMDRPLQKEDHLDGKSIESSREEDDDEDDAEAARSAAINQEIKRILTEVLLKVTDELFDEIATKVLDEDDVNVEVERKAVASGETPKSSAKVVIPAKTKGTDVDDVSGKSSSSSPGDVLGLGSYASDDDDEEKEVENSSTKSSNPTVHQVENGSSQVEEEKDSRGVSPNGAIGNHEAKEHHNDNSDEEKVKPVSSNISKSKQSVSEDGVNAENSLPDDSRGRSPRNGPMNGVEGKSDKKTSSSKDNSKEVESGKDMKVDEKRRTHEERHIKRAKKEDQNGSKERIHGDSGKRASKGDVKDDKEERERDRRPHGKEDGRKRERGKDEKKEGSKYKSVGGSSRHRSPSPGGRGRSSKDNSAVTHAYASTDTSSDDSRRKVHSKKRNLSKSPVRSRRQVSRSPPSKRSQHRHSIYSSLENTRERRRSRSRSRRG